MATTLPRHGFLLDGEGTSASRSGFPDHLKKVAATPPLPKVRVYEVAAPDPIYFDHLDEVGKGLGELKIEEGTREVFPAPVNSFKEAGLAKAVLQNIAPVSPWPVQSYLVPMVLAGRDLLVCAQEGSGKAAALCMLVVSELVRKAPEGGRTYGHCAEPRALLLVPNDKSASKIGEHAGKIAHQTGIRVVYSRAKNTQMHELGHGVDILISTPRHLINLLEKSRVTLEAIEYLVIYDICWMVDLGFEEELRMIVDMLPGKSSRQTLLSSDTFEPEVQKLAWDFLSNYLLISDGRMEFSVGLTKQTIKLVPEVDKIGSLLNVLREQSFTFAGVVYHRPTVVFMETRQDADFFRDLLYDKGFPTTVIFGDSFEETDRERKIICFQRGLTPILIAADAASLCFDVSKVNYVINYHLPKSIEEYIKRLRKFRRARRIGSVTSFFTESNQSIAKGLWELMIEAKLEVPEWLVDYADPDYSCRFKKLELQDEEHEKYRYDLAGSLVSRKFNDIRELVVAYAELNCKSRKKSSLEDDITRMSRVCCIAFEQQEEFKLLEFKFVKLIWQCFIPEKFGKTYHHYNFKAETKNNESGIWIQGTYFAESKRECGVQKYFCCLLEPSDNGQCYGCQNDVADIRHPTTGDYQKGTPDYVWPYDDDDVGMSDSDDDLMEF